MTVETLHDALTLLPADLVAAADKRRGRKRGTVHWQQWAAMAACFVLVFCAGTFAMLVMTPMGGSTKSTAAMDMEAASREEAVAEAPAAAAPAEAGPMETVAANETGGTGSTMTQEAASDWCGVLAPGFLEAQWFETPYGSAVNHGSTPYVTLAASAGELESYMNRRDFQDMSSLQNLAALQEEGWFELYDLLLVQLPYVTDPSILEIQETEEGWILVLPEQTTGAPVWSYHLVLTVEKGLVPNGEAVTVSFGG